MIFPTYRAFRHGFALPGALTDPTDGMPVFPVEKLRTGGFSGTLKIHTGLPNTSNPADLRTLSVANGFASVSPFPQSEPLQITCNDYAADAVAGVHDFDWFLSQRVDVSVHDPDAVIGSSILTEPALRRDAVRYFTFFPLSLTQSGTVRISFDPTNVKKLAPNFIGLQDLTDADLRTVLKNVHIYVQRRSDKAYQWVRLYA